MSWPVATCAGHRDDHRVSNAEDTHDAGAEPLPEVMFLPLAVPDEEGFDNLDAGVLARRIPDFVHQVLNQGQVGPTGVLEVQSPPEDGPVVWVVMDAPPEPEEAFALLPDDAEVRAVVTGEVLPVRNGLRVEFHVYFTEDGEERFTSKVGGVIGRDDPMPGLLQLVRRLARMLELPFHEPPRSILTRSGRAFFTFLRGLDNAMLLSGDLQIATPDDREALMRPFAEALALDPGFGLALRVAHTTMALALAGSQLDHDAARRFLDRCYSAQPFDGEGCVAVADQLREMGDDKRAIAWLEHATHLDPPPPRGLENLGILFANRGETVAARDLWLRGLSVDGHPDFFAHLARLHFAEDRELDAWEMIVRGLRRLHERTLRAGEWDDQERGAGVLLQYLHEHLAEHTAPADVVEALLDLRGLLTGDDQVHLGLCLLDCQRRLDARTELAAASMDREIGLDTRDQCVRALLAIDVTDFEKRFSRAADQATHGSRPRECLGEFQLWLQLQPMFWPALFFSASAKRRLGETDEALDLLVAAHRLAPRSEVCHQMALLFDDRGNPKRALELIDEALAQKPDEAQLCAAKVQFLLRLSRRDEARRCLQRALEVAGNDRELLRLAQQVEQAQDD